MKKVDAAIFATAVALATPSLSVRAFHVVPPMFRAPHGTHPSTSATSYAVSPLASGEENGHGPSRVTSHKKTARGFSPLHLCPGENHDIGSTSTAMVAPYGDNGVTSSRGGAWASKALRSAGVALAWYLCSSAAAVAVASVSGLPVEARPTRRVPVGPTLLLLYVLSDKKMKKRHRFAGVVPKDDESRKLLADDAYDLALSWGKPAGRIALLAVDVFCFLFIFRFSGYDFIKLFRGQGMAQLSSLNFWVPYGVIASIAGAGLTVFIRRFGKGYIRSTVATAIAPGIRAAFIKPAKNVASIVGVGDDWDLGLTAEQRKGRRSSRQLRESLSTFKDVNFHDDVGSEGGQQQQEQQEPLESEQVSDDGAPPDLKRTS